MFVPRVRSDIHGFLYAVLVLAGICVGRLTTLAPGSRVWYETVGVALFCLLIAIFRLERMPHPIPKATWRLAFLGPLLGLAVGPLMLYFAAKGMYLSALILVVVLLLTIFGFSVWMIRRQNQAKGTA